MVTFFNLRRCNIMRILEVASASTFLGSFTEVLTFVSKLVDTKGFSFSYRSPMVRGTFDSPFFDLECLIFFAADFVEVFLLGLVGGTIVIGSTSLGVEESVSCGSATRFSSKAWGFDLVDMVMWLIWRRLMMIRAREGCDAREGKRKLFS